MVYTRSTLDCWCSSEPNHHSNSVSLYIVLCIDINIVDAYCIINGFRADRCCQDHIFVLTSIIENRMAKKEDTFTCFIDFKKAFDCVSREFLWRKLETRFCLSGNMLLALYEDVRCSVSVNNIFTDWFSVNSGVKQGCILSPTFFAMFVDPGQAPNCRVRMVGHSYM